MESFDTADGAKRQCEAVCGRTGAMCVACECRGSRGAGGGEEGGVYGGEAEITLADVELANIVGSVLILLVPVVLVPASPLGGFALGIRGI